MQAAFALPAELTIYSASELRGQWLAWLADGERADEAQYGECCAVDAAAVDQVDAAGVQLLVSLSRALGGRNRRLQLAQASGPLVSACESLGLDSLLAHLEPNGVAT